MVHGKLVTICLIIGNHNCSHEQDVNIACYNGSDYEIEPDEGAWRIAGGGDAGLLEVYFQGSFMKFYDGFRELFIVFQSKGCS